MITYLMLSLSDWSDIISLFTPIILLCWFLYSQWQLWRKNFYENIVGTYAGFSIPVTIIPRDGATGYAGLILDITEIDHNGYFIGQLLYGEVESSQSGNNSKVAAIVDLYGKIHYEFYFQKNIDPFEIKKNSKYYGKLSLIQRFDFGEDQKIHDFLDFEYEIIYYRERKSLSFTEKKVVNQNLKLPSSFSVLKKISQDTGLYNNVLETIIRVNTLFGKKFRNRDQL